MCTFKYSLALGNLYQTVYITANVPVTLCEGERETHTVRQEEGDWGGGDCISQRVALKQWRTDDGVCGGGIKDIEDGVKIPSLAAVWLHLGLQLT